MFTRFAQCLVLALLAISSPMLWADREIIAQGQYIFQAAGCRACHTDSENEGLFLAGGRAFKTPFGTFYSPNISSDPKHGIGAWSEVDLKRALTEGKAPGGSDYYPVFPFTSYSAMSDGDIHALYSYLMSTAPAAVKNRDHDLPWWMRFRFTNRIWKLLFFKPGPIANDPGQSTALKRGAYLVNALAHCGECHTPRNILGVTDKAMYLAGNPNGPDEESIPNITPDPTSGIGDWSESEVIDYLESGLLPDGDYAGGLMSEVIDEGLQHLTDQDRKAIAVYLKSLPPISNPIGVD